MKKVILYCWQLPQNIIGLLYSIFSDSSKEHSVQDVDIYRKKKNSGSVTLGKYIILDKYATDTTIRHEYGHTIQSKILGPLYLIIIGIPSIIHAIFHRKGSYYHFYTESWANKLTEKVKYNEQ